MKAPLLSVCLITYNHENFIRQAIEGVLMQIVNFDWELIIADDCSTDNTRAVILECKEKYPDFIKLILQETNVGAAKNWLDLITTPKSKYIAYFEGDDYWTDSSKLQKQVDFLESNKDYALCFHPVKVWQAGHIIEDTITAKVPETTTINDLAKGNYMHTCSVVFRNNLFAELPEYFKSAPVGDYFLHMLNARYGTIKRFDEIMGVYRVHGNSYWSTKTQEERELIWVPFLKNIKPNFNEEVQGILNAQIACYTKPKDNKNFLWLIEKVIKNLLQRVKPLF